MKLFMSLYQLLRNLCINWLNSLIGYLNLILITLFFFFLNDTAPPEIYPLPLPAAFPILLFARQRATFLEHCPAGTPGLVCCNYLVVSLISNCPMDCSYCFLQEYLANNPTLKVFTNVEDRKSTRLNSSHSQISYAVFCLKK